MTDKIRQKRSEFLHAVMALRLDVASAIADDIKQLATAVFDAYEEELHNRSVRLFPADVKNNPIGKVVIMQGDKVIGAQG